MADDKGGGGGGGWEWGALEIILAVLLVIGLLEHLSGNKKPFTISDNPAPSTLSQAEDAMCGLMLHSPKPLQKFPVGAAIALSGEVSGCLWSAEGDVSLYAQAVDSKGFPVSPYTTVLPTRRDNGVAEFDAIVPITGVPAAGTGYLILIPSEQRSDASVTARIPISFSK